MDFDFEDLIEDDNETSKHMRPIIRLSGIKNNISISVLPQTISLINRSFPKRLILLILDLD